MGLTCTCCQHAKRAELDRMLALGASVRHVARTFSVGPSAVQRHKRAHIATQLARSAARKEVRELDAAERLLAELRGSKDVVWRALQEIEGLADGQRLAALPGLLAAARVHCEITQVLLKVEEARSAIQTLPGRERGLVVVPAEASLEQWQAMAARLVGQEGLPGPAKSLLDSRAWMRIRSAIMAALEAHPAAREAVVAALRQHEEEVAERTVEEGVR